MDWISVVDKFFDYIKTPKDKQVKLIACKFLGGALAWWVHLPNEKRMVNKAPDVTWARMKQLMI